jgi:hypothetical protein
MENLLDNQNILNDTLSGLNPFFADGEIPDSVAEKSGLKHRLIFDSRLSKGIGFSSKELAANRDGYLTGEQMRSMGSQWPKITVWLFLAATFFVFADQDSFRDLMSALICCSLPFGIIAIAGIVYSWLHDPSGQVASITGAVFPDLYGSARILVNGLELELPNPTGPIFVEGDHYVVYYVPETQVIVAAERIEYD